MIQNQKRAHKLRDLYYQTLSSADNEFPYWYTRSYLQNHQDIPVVRRAKALKMAFSHLTPVVYPGELIVMQKNCFYRGSFPMPWLSEGYYLAKRDQLTTQTADQHSMLGNGGGNVTMSFGPVVSLAGKFGMRQEEIPMLIKLAECYEGHSVESLGRKYEQMVPDFALKDQIMQSLICMFDSGYTLPQGREVTNYYYPLQYGFEGLKKMAQEQMEKSAGKANGDGRLGMNRLYNYEAIILVIEGVQKWILNYAKESRRTAEITPSTEIKIKEDYLKNAEICEWIAYNPPRHFREALQLCWTLHIAVLNEDAISGLSPGRLGQVLYPYYEQDMENGVITKEEVLELLTCQRVKFTCIDCFASMGVVGGVLSGNTFNNLCLGGVNQEGQSAVNELEMLILEAGMELPTPQPTLTVIYEEDLPESFLIKSFESIRKGVGYPAIVNNRKAMDFLLENYRSEGMTLKEARAWAIGGCLETSPGSWMPLTHNNKTYFIPGGSGAPTSVGVHFISLPKLLELVLFRGVDKRRGVALFPDHGLDLKNFAELWKAFQLYFEKSVEVLTLCNNIQHDIWRKKNMAIFHSLLKPDCLSTGHLIDEKGYRYNATFNVETTGTINLINSFAAIKKRVFEEQQVSLEELKSAMLENFGYLKAKEIHNYSLAHQRKNLECSRWDALYALLLKAPKYGNDDPYADSLLKDWQNYFTSVVKRYESLFAHPLYACQISVSTHGPMGAVTLASPDGRLEGTTFADGSLSAYPGSDREGIYALLNSASCWDHSTSQNSQLNLKIHPSAVEGMQGCKKLIDLTRSYMRLGGFHVQYNVIDSQILREAQVHPESYRDLMVRVAGFTQYWVELGKAIQDEVLARTEYRQF